MKFLESHCKNCPIRNEIVKDVLSYCESVFDAESEIEDRLKDCKNTCIKEVMKNMEGKKECTNPIVDRMIKILKKNRDCGTPNSPKFGGYIVDDKTGNYVYIKQVIYNAPATVVFWSDGVKTTSKCDKRDIYNPEMGLVLAVMKRLTSNEYVTKLVHDWAPEGEQKYRTLADVRKCNR